MKKYLKINLIQTPTRKMDKNISLNFKIIIFNNKVNCTSILRRNSAKSTHMHEYRDKSQA